MEIDYIQLLPPEFESFIGATYESFQAVSTVAKTDTKFNRLLNTLNSKF